MGIVGAILGDIAGSKWEFGRPENLDWNKIELFDEGCAFTDDSVMSLACKYALQNDTSFTEAYQLFGRKYPNVSYGGMFYGWIWNDKPTPYYSFGNGSAMRVSYCGEYAKTLQEARLYAANSAACTHNHPEGIKGAVSVAEAIWMSSNGASKKDIKEYVEKNHGYNLDFSIDGIRRFYRLDVTCQGSVPVAFVCLLESEDYESCIRKVLSLKCDTDTIGAIAGSMAESLYKTTGFDDKALLNKYLDKFLLDTLYK